MKKRSAIRFFAAAFLTAFFFALDGGSDLKMLFQHRNAGETDVMYYSYMAFHYGLYHYMFLVFAMIPCGLGFCEEWKSGVFLMTLKRRGKRGYAVRMVLKGAFAGGGAAAFGYLLYVFFLRMFVPFYSPAGGNAVAFATLPFAGLLESGWGGLYFLLQAYFVFLTAAFFSGAAVYISFHLPNPYVALFSAFFCYRVVKEVGKMIRLPEALQIPLLLGGEIRIGSECLTLAVMTGVVGCFLIWMIRRAKKVLQKRCEDGDV
ncbi:MAG: hypothetical protein HFI93_03000 [Lachnospiraceae bacterium]|nr:hypothetical protein [Lachnospiraceae bacterium]